MPVLLPLTTILFCALLVAPPAVSGAVTVLAPSQPSVDTPTESPGKARNASQGGRTAVEAPEVDILYAMMDIFAYAGESVDRPQLFASLRYDGESGRKDGALVPERLDLLGDMEEISYLGEKAWGINIALEKAGLYQFIAEGRPRWDALKNRFVQQTAKTMLPVMGLESGWDQAAGLNFEIVPLSRPFGLTAPAIFSGRLMFRGKPLPDAPVSMQRINADKKSGAGRWSRDMRAVTDANGQFVFLLAQGGWWGCMASADGDVIKGPEGQASPLELGTLLWLYVDDAAPAAHKKQ